MPNSAFVNFKAIKAAVSMEQVLDHYGILGQFKKSGDSLSGPCPIHKGSNPTQFRVSISKNIFNCFSECKHGGNVLDFIAKMENVSIHGAAMKAVEWFNIDPESVKSDSEQEEHSEVKTTERAPKAKAVTLTPVPKEEKKPNKPLNFRLENLDRSHPYLTEERRLDKETILDFGVGYFTGKKGIMVNRIVIPIHNEKGELMAYAGRWPGEQPDKETEKYKLPPGFWKTLELFNIDRAIREAADKPLLIVEGFFGCMRIHQLGYRKVIALMGSTIDDAQVELIRRHTNSKSRIIIVFDEDEAGRDGRVDVAARLSKFCFVKTNIFEQEDMQADQLSAEELHEILGGEM